MNRQRIAYGLLGLACVLCLLTASGCADVKVDAGNLFGGPSENAAKPAPNPALDFRSPQQLVDENNRLRQQLLPQEKNNQSWTFALKQREQEVRELKRQRDELKKQRKKD